MLARLGLHPGFRSEKAFWEKELTLEGEFAEFVSASLDPDRMEGVFPAGVSPYIQQLRWRFGQRRPL